MMSKIFMFLVVVLSIAIIARSFSYKIKSINVVRQLSMNSFFKFGSTSTRSQLTVIGANGKTGTKIVNLAAQKGLNVNAVTKNGYNATDIKVGKTKIKDVNADIKSDSNSDLIGALKCTKACFFAASASKTGGTPQQIDRDGLIKIAKLCIENEVPRLVIISSGAVSKPFSPVYLFLNLFGGIMKAKIEGENEVRKLYNSEAAKSKKLGYTIIRPGGLTQEPPKGLSAIELNQGDDRSGRISRWDVASIALECINSNSAACTTFECYDRDTSQPLANVGLNNILKKRSNA